MTAGPVASFVVRIVHEAGTFDLGLKGFRRRLWESGHYRNNPPHPQATAFADWLDSCGAIAIVGMFEVDCPTIAARFPRFVTTMVQRATFNALEAGEVIGASCATCGSVCDPTSLRIEAWRWSAGLLAGRGGRTVMCASGHELMRSTEWYS